VTRSKPTDEDPPSVLQGLDSDEACRSYLEELRWPDGIRCPRCDGSRIARIRARRQYDCSSCRYRFSVTAGTVFHDSHLPLWKWFAAVYLMTEGGAGLTSVQLTRTLAVTEKTAWYLAHRIRAAMRDRSPMVSDASSERARAHGGSRPATAKEEAEGAPSTLQTDSSMRRGDQERTAGAALSESIVRVAISERLDGADHAYFSLSGDTERAWTVLKRSIRSSHHKVSIKHLPAYLDEVTFRYTRRNDPALFRETLQRLIGEEPLSYRDLTRSDS
jgi:transposase-like protein